MILLEKVYTVYEVANILKVHYNTVYELIRQKKLKAIRIGTSYRITESYLNELIKNSLY